MSLLIYIADLQPGNSPRFISLADNLNITTAEVAFRYSSIQGFRHTHSSCGSSCGSSGEAHHNIKPANNHYLALSRLTHNHIKLLRTRYIDLDALIVLHSRRATKELRGCARILYVQ